MSKRVFVIIMTVLLLCFLMTGQSFAVNRVVLKLAVPGSPVSGAGVEAGVFPKEREVMDMLLQKYRAEIKSLRFHSFTGYYIAETVSGSEADLEELSGRLRRDPSILDASPDYPARIAAVTPNDMYFQYQYALSNSGQIYHPASGARGTSGSDIKASDAWDWTMGGEEVIIAIVDTGVALGHEDLVNKIVPGYNFIDGNFNTQDDNGHGTLVASIAAAETNNGVGIAGVSWNARIMPFKVLDQDGNGSLLAIAAAIRYATNNGTRVINLSLASLNPSFILEDALRYAYERGVVLVAATGNNAANVLYPAAYDDYCIAVAATDANDHWLPISGSGPQVDVAAPGKQIVGAFYSPLEPQNLGSYTWGDGTSFAAPHVSGAVALLLSYKPFLTNSEVMTLIRVTADDVNAADFPGVDSFLGYGRLNLLTLLEPFRLGN
jgi:subtilisin family serine protease